MSKPPEHMNKDLVQFAKTPRQKEILEAFLETNSKQAAADKLGISRSTVRTAIDRVTKYAASLGWSPDHDMTRTVPEGFHVKGVSTYYNSDGEPAGQWVKSSKNRENDWEVIKEACENLGGSIRRVKPIKPPKHSEEDLLTLYPLTDVHVGLIATDTTDFENRVWNMRSQEEVIMNCARRMISNSPKSSKCIVGQLGDFLHWDGLMPVTPRSGHILDADCFFQEMFQLGVDILRGVIDLCLHHHDTVDVINSEGNHDESTSAAIRVLLNCLYEKEPRVTVDMSNHPYAAYEHGKTMLLFHHGHLKKMEQLHEVMVTDFGKMWGRTKHRYAHCGHRHSYKEIDKSGARIIQHTTLAPRDRYASRHGYSSSTEARAITYHKEHGEVNVNVVRPYS